MIAAAASGTLAAVAGRHGALHRAFLPAACAAACLLGGCTGSLFQSKAAAPTVYLLSAKLAMPGTEAASPTPASRPTTLGVLRPRVRKGLDTDRIAVLYGDRRLDYFAAAHWSGPLDEVMQDLVVQAFRTGSNLGNVSADASEFASAYWLELEVVDFQAEYASMEAPPTIRVRLAGRVGNAGDRRLLGSFAATTLQPATENRLAAIVDAYEKALDAALLQIVTQTVGAIDNPPNAARAGVPR